MPEYSFCEATTAGSRSRWHIRPLTKVGRKLGGGADTQALCGRLVAWDIATPVTPTSPVLEDGVCSTCRVSYEERVKGEQQ